MLMEYSAWYHSSHILNKIISNIFERRKNTINNKPLESIFVLIFYGNQPVRELHASFTVNNFSFYHFQIGELKKKIQLFSPTLMFHKLSLGSYEVPCTKFGPDRVSRFDVYWIQTNKQTDKQRICRLGFLGRFAPIFYFNF